MYNGIGLQTARGSGTSGYIQKNLSYNVKKLQSKEQFLKQLEQQRKNSLPAPRKANPQIIEHERKRQILIHTMKLRQKLESEGKQPEQIEQTVKKAQAVLREKLEKGQLQTKNKDSHLMTEAKQKQYKKISNAFGLSETSQPGSAFDFEAQRVQRLERMEEKRIKKSLPCPHEGCSKVYDNQPRLDRHLKYKHPKEVKQIQNE